MDGCGELAASANGPAADRPESAKAKMPIAARVAAAKRFAPNLCGVARHG